MFILIFPWKFQACIQCLLAIFWVSILIVVLKMHFNFLKECHKNPKASVSNHVLYPMSNCLLFPTKIRRATILSCAHEHIEQRVQSHFGKECSHTHSNWHVLVITVLTYFCGVAITVPDPSWSLLLDVTCHVQ